MKNNRLPTEFAPAERLKGEEIQKQVQLFNKYETLTKVLNEIPAVLIIVNQYRQILYLNQGAISFTGLEDVATEIGKRPGEVFQCIHSNDGPGGCGTSEACTYCGAVRSEGQ